MASDNTYQPKVRFVENGDTMDVATGGKITAEGTQAVAVAVPTDLASTIVAVTAIITALENVGILATS